MGTVHATQVASQANEPFVLLVMRKQTEAQRDVVTDTEEGRMWKCTPERVCLHSISQVPQVPNKMCKKWVCILVEQVAATPRAHSRGGGICLHPHLCT